MRKFIIEIFEGKYQMNLNLEIQVKHKTFGDEPEFDEPKKIFFH